MELESPEVVLEYIREIGYGQLAHEKMCMHVDLAVDCKEKLFHLSQDYSCCILLNTPLGYGELFYICGLFDDLNQWIFGAVSVEDIGLYPLSTRRYVT